MEVGSVPVAVVGGRGLSLVGVAMSGALPVSARILKRKCTDFANESLSDLRKVEAMLRTFATMEVKKTVCDGHSRSRKSRRLLRSN
jgi:hypothetical protein